ncbi:hypothetical protein GJ496_002891 [Pomphorhynchus laevis]|nr:hypothetical protein GJ496_002891 [Pomphorhynchus laevis]
MLSNRSVPILIPIKNKFILSRFLSAAAVATIAAPPIDFSQRADVVVCGAGIVGCSVAYLLAKTRVRNVILVDQHWNSDCGSTSHCESFFTHAHPSRHEILWTKLSRQLYDEVDESFGDNWFSNLPTDFDEHQNPKGSFTIATTPNRAIENRRINSLLTAASIRSEILDPYKLSHFFPSMNSDNIVNALWVPDDIQMNANRIRQSLLNAAVSMGVKYYPDCKVINVSLGASSRSIPKVVGVHTKQGYVHTPVFINCAGSWASAIKTTDDFRLNICVGGCLISSMTSLPFSSYSQFPYLWCDPDHDTWLLHKADIGRVVLCGINTAASVPQHELKDMDSLNDIKPCPDHVQRVLSAALYRFPLLKLREVGSFTTSMDSFSYDNNLSIGEVESVMNYYVVSGMNGKGLMFAGAAAVILQSLLDRSRSQYNLHFISPSRYSFTRDNEVFRQSRTSEICMRTFDLRDTNRDFQFYQTCRGLRVSPLFDVLQSYKAVFGSQYGFEWPLFFDSESHIDSNNIVFANLYREPHYIDNVKREYMVCKQKLGICDMSGFVKLLIESPSTYLIRNFLQRVCCTHITDIDHHISRGIILNRLGTYECDTIIAKLNDHMYLLVAPCSQTTHCLPWLRRQLRKDENITISDITTQYGVLNLVGPMASKFLESVTHSDMSIYDFQASALKKLNIDGVNDVLTMRMSYTGEDGFTLFVPSQEMRLLYNRLLHIGKSYGIENVGYLAIRTLRIEHGIDYWGVEVSQRVTPIECNKGNLVQMNKHFKGKDALIDSMSHGVQQKLFRFTTVTLEDNVWPAEGDPIYENDSLRGYISSAAYSFNLKKHVCLGFLFYKEIGQLSRSSICNRKFQVEICGTRLSLIPFL